MSSSLQIMVDPPIMGKDWSLPSVNPLCTAIQLHVRCLNIPCLFKIQHYPYSTLHSHLEEIKQNLPLGVWGPDRVSDLTTYLAEHYLDIDEDFVDARAYRSFIMMELEPVHAWVMWLEEITHGRCHMDDHYAERLPFLLREWLQVSRRSYEQRRLRDRRLDSVERVQQQVNMTFSYLSSQLGAQPFLFGQLPCSADFLLAAYIANLYHVPQHKEEIELSEEDMKDPLSVSALIQTLLHGPHSNLLRHAQSIHYFYLSPRPDEQKSATEALNANILHSTIARELEFLQRTDAESLWDQYTAARAYGEYNLKEPRALPALLSRAEGKALKLEREKDAKAKAEARAARRKRTKNYYAPVLMAGLVIFGLELWRRSRNGSAGGK